MRRIDNEKLVKISSMEELSRAKRSVKRAIRRTEKHIGSEFANAKDMYSKRDAVFYGISLVDSIQSMTRYTVKGFYHSIMDAYRRNRRGYVPAGESCGCRPRRRH